MCGQKTWHIKCVKQCVAVTDTRRGVCVCVCVCVCVTYQLNLNHLTLQHYHDAKTDVSTSQSEIM